MIEFFLNGQPEKLEHADPNMSILDWLRTKKRLTGTKEGCASGDCGACTILAGSLDADGRWQYVSMNSCIALIGTMHGKHILTIDALQQTPTHPVQQAMVECHGSQCGFCTPGIVMSLIALHQEHMQKASPQGAYCAREGTQQEEASLREQVLEALSGNLCRCTGYRPIIEAGEKALAVQIWDGSALLNPAADAPVAAPDQPVELTVPGGNRFDAPTSLDALRSLLARHPDARLIAGGTDLALEITQQLKQLPHLVSLEYIPELKQLVDGPEGLYIGAAVTYRSLEPVLSAHWPAFKGLLKRLGSRQIRNRGTLGGNIGNASPIGDMPPSLIALGARIQLDGINGERWQPLEDFFLAYKQTALQPGEFIRGVEVPAPGDGEHLFLYKVSKRLDDDISAVLGAFWFRFEGDRIADCRLAYGGMAATPKRALHAEAALRGQPWNEASVQRAIAALASDFTPLSDVRASAGYRMQVAGNLLRRALLESQTADSTGPAITVIDYA